MRTVSFSLLRDGAAVVIVVIACPAALFGGSLIGCFGQGFQADCAMNAAFISPVLLLAAGMLAGLVTRGWTGLMLTFVGTLIGMTAILVLSFGVSTPVPLDPISGLIATAWFFAPVSVGYGVGRLVWRLIATRDGGSNAPG